MSSFFSFDCVYSPGGDQRSQRWAVIYCSREDLNTDVFCPHLVSHLERNPPPDAIYILAHQTNKEFLLKLRDDEKFLDRLPSVLRSARPLPVYCTAITRTGEFVPVLPGSRPKAKDIREPIFQAGIKAIFQRRGGILPASPAYHYVKPSGKHCDRFIRSAEILVDGGEVDFIASRLLPYVDDTTDYIFCDSASISQLAYAVMKLRKSANPSWKNPVVDTFRSYAGILDYDFRRARNPLCLISASTSGDMARMLSEKGVPANKIVILFYLGDPVEVGEIIHDLSYDPLANPTGFPKIPVFSAGACPFCKQGSSRIRMSPDYFIPENPVTESLLIKRRDAPSWLRRFLSRYHGTGTMRAHYLPGMRGFTHEIFLDVQRALTAHSGNTHFRNCFDQVLTRTLPAALTRVIHLHDDASQAMAVHAVDVFRQFNDKKEIQIIDANSVTATPSNFIESEGTTLVVASSLVDGRSLMELSQVLRSIQKNGCLAFIIGIARFVTQSALDEARSNVTQTEMRATHFDFHVIETVFVPDNTAHRCSSWDDEQDLLLKLQRRKCTKKLTEIIENRLQTISGASARDRSGVQDELFWPTVNGKPLVLRPNFAFFQPPSDSNPLTQSEVFFTISAVLHNLRHSQDSDRSLRPLDGRRIVIEPTTFYRLNDGIIQSALLRACLESEIDYRVDETKSATMREVIRSILQDCDKDRGEAASEFLLALCLGRLKLTDTDTEQLIKDMQSKIDSFPILSCLGNYVVEEVLKQTKSQV
jgi:hypothetical protein